MDQDYSKQTTREFCDSDAMCTSSLKEISLIETVTSFLEENGAGEVDPRILKNLAEALSKRISTDDTSPGGMQDVTMETSYTSFDAARAAGGIHSPMQGRSVRELEEQMSTLRKENFNLKLRIYFMEEGQHGSRGGKTAADSPAKQLIDSKIEIEILRKRVDEKTELLKDAARAISQHEEMQKKADLESQAMIEQMQQYIQQLESSAKQKVTKNSMDSLDTEKFKALEAELLNLENALLEADLRETESKRHQELLTADLAEKQETLMACEAKIEELAIKNAKLLEQLEKRNNDSNQQTNAQPELRAQLADKICELQDAEEKLKERERVHEKACRTIQKLMQKLSSQEKEINRHKQQKQQQNKSLTENSSPAKQLHSLSDTEACAVDISRSLKQRYEKQIEDQDELIKQLQSEVKKKTANLQNLVNKELWEKNREVERLTKLVSGKQHSQQSVEHSGDDSTGGVDLQQSFTEADFVKAVKRNQLLQRKVDVLLQRLGSAQEETKLASQLKQELQNMQLKVENANKWRLECADVCSVLTNRLDELAGFLNSLLKHKDVLGVLAADRRHAMRRAVDRSLDLSKSLNMTLSITGVSLADQSLAQLSKLSEMLYNDADECNHTYNSHEDLQAAKAAKAEARKERRSLPLPQQLDNQSESEAWSEPDRKVSLARIGLEDTSNSIAGEQHHSESDSEGHACATNTMKQERRSERIGQLETLIAQRDERLLQAQCQLVEADNRYKQEQLRVLELSQQLDQLRLQNEALHADLRAIGCQEEQQMEELQSLIEQKTQQLEKLQVEHKTLQADAQITEIELHEARQQLLEIQKENETKFAEFQLEVSQRLEAQHLLQQQELERNWVALTQYEELKSQLVHLQSSLEFYQENEKELKQTLVENELSSRALKKELDESTLQASKAIMERTKAYNDKLQLEQRLEEIKLQLVKLQDEQKQKQRQREPSDVSQSGYTSEELPQRQRVGRLSNPSPDLGIESDTGRVHSVELSNTQHPLLKTVELVNDDILDEKNDLSPDTELPAGERPVSVPVHDCLKVEQENAELRRKLIRTKRAFEDTYEKLRVVNKAKAQVEKDIKNQILKTHNVLRNVRSNMENVL
ncbi:centrosomin isoform X1 [Drosophila hydei]|uniref:Centrosomin isoform X1 n=1 Tax=Drosophila hydei TaxID=7224 RepID=A0A6J1LXP1_DROHY|nr:centrosomin isoform X1 [Drosophila hydei]